ncbi:MAG: adenylyl-sulfate kinase [Chitinophagaceae bacterium]|jgi:adenylyl-sulfate kinase|nr:adenylyl-sulfate kinase [Chitinophagaceae bacterium]MCU0405070.1 adenylyl-sulfate kinase [Chitinophagaceae bacterium]
MLHIHPSTFKVSRTNRSEKLNQTPRLIWFTGLSGSGKSTLANALEFLLYSKGYATYLMDGDNVRTGLCKDLTFSIEDRIENIRRIAEVGNLMLDAGLIVLSAFISPFIADREMISRLVGAENFLEIYVDCPIEVCEARDVKGLYNKARQGLIPNFTGIDSPYEPPINPFAQIKTNEMSLETSVQYLFDQLEPRIIY